MERFTIGKQKLAEIIYLCWRQGISHIETCEFIQADWPNAAEHQRWLKNASVQEIVSWVVAGQK